MDELEQIRNNIKNKRNKPINYNKKTTSLSKYITKLLLVCILTIITLILLKSDIKLKELFYKHIYDNSISFVQINSWYQDKFGNPLPFKNLFNEKTTPVFEEKLKYKEINKYKNGALLTVDNKYLTPAIKTGMVIFMGEKDGYKNTVIIESSDGIEIWYSNISNLNIKLYDYIEKGNLIGETINDKLYINIKKNGKNENYKKYIS